MFSKITSVLLLLSLCLATFAQTAKDVGAICLNPYIPEAEGLGPQTSKMVRNKLVQAATASGMSGSGFDDRFVITTHIQILDISETQTYPQKTVLKANIGVYVGDGLDGTLFSSYIMEAKGLGDDKDQAIAAAVRKINPNAPELQAAILKGKEKIMAYYDRMAPQIVSKAEATAASGNYDDAITMLLAIPMSNKSYTAAQRLVGQYSRTALDAKNLAVVVRARSAWSANPTEEGAAEAQAILDGLDLPSPKVQAEVQKLSGEMAARLKAVSDREYRLEVKKANDEKEVAIATVNAAASVARAYYANRPKVVYHIHWW